MVEGMKNMKHRYMIIATLVLGLVLAQQLTASQYMNARSLAMAKSFTSLALSYNSLGVNPANLAFEDNYFGVELFSAEAQLNNNSFSLSDYNTYNGQHWTQADKDEILSRVPETGLRGNAESGASALAVATGSFAFGLTAEGDGRINLDKQVLELILNGNSPGQTVDVTNAFGGGTAHADFNISYGAKLMTASWGEINWGANIKYIYGIAYAEVEDASASAVTELYGFSAEGAVNMKTSQGGSGFGLDLGLATVYNDNWKISMAVTNLVSSIKWNKNNKLNTYIFTVDNLTLETSEDDSTVTSQDYETNLDDFSTSLAPQLAIGASTRYKSLLLGFDFKQGFKDQGMVSTTPEVSVGCEASFLNALPVRAGLAVGGIDGSRSAVGFGLNLSPFTLDVAYVSTGSLIPIGGKGMGLAISSGLKF